MYSIYYPEISGEENQFWEGKGGAIIPQGKESGWLIKESLKNRWHLHLGKTKGLLNPLRKDVGKIDIFTHDSEHSYECMWHEFITAWNHASNSGHLLSDDTGLNCAFFDFANINNETPGRTAGNIGVITKDKAYEQTQ